MSLVETKCVAFEGKCVLGTRLGTKPYSANAVLFKFSFQDTDLGGSLLKNTVCCSMQEDNAATSTRV